MLASDSSVTMPSWPERAACVPPHAGVVADLDDPDGVAVLLAEQRHRADAPGLVLGRHEGADLEVGERDLVDLLLDVLKDGHGYGAGAGEVEAEAAGCVERAGLGGLLAQRGPEGLVHQVGRGVGARDRPAPLGVDDRQDAAADGDLAAEDPRPVHDQVGQ